VVLRAYMMSLDKARQGNTAYGSTPENPRNQNSCLLDMRLFAQAKNE
jgi:hypothetical protein